jgi:hypothetical protein
MIIASYLSWYKLKTQGARIVFKTKYIKHKFLKGVHSVTWNYEFEHGAQLQIQTLQLIPTFLGACISPIMFHAKTCQTYTCTTYISQFGTGLKITGDMSPVKMTGQLDFSSVKICFWPVIDTLILTVKQTIRNLFRYIIVSCFNSRRQQSHWKAWKCGLSKWPGR